MLRVLGLCAALALCGCQTMDEVTGDSALAGQPIDSALALYGPWEEYAVIDGKPIYIWRRHYTSTTPPAEIASGTAASAATATRISGPTDYYCELRVEMGFRRLISRSLMQGYPDACRMFSVRYRNTKN